MIYRSADSDHPFARLAHRRESVVPVPGAFLEPYLRSCVVEAYDEEVRPIIKKLPLPVGNTDAVGLPT